MRVALVLTGGLHPSGRQQVIPAWLWTIEALARRHEIHAFVLRHLPSPATYLLAGATIHDLGRPGSRWSQWHALRAAISSAGPFDVIHGYWADPGGILAALAGRRLGIPSVITCDSGEFATIPDIGYGLQRTVRGRAMVAVACRLATRVHVTTRFMQSLAAAHGHEAVMIPMGVDLRRVSHASPPENGPPWRVLQVASLNRVKDHATALRALAIARRSIDTRLDLAGEDTLGGSVQREAAALDLTGVVTFHGFVPNDALGPLHRAAHVYLQSSRHEAAGVSVLEAAAAGVPVLGTRVGYVSDWAPHAAVAVAPGDAAALASALVALLQNPLERRAIAARARQFVAEHDVQWTASALTALYDSIRR